jgi:hypothetical protein
MAKVEEYYDDDNYNPNRGMKKQKHRNKRKRSKDILKDYKNISNEPVDSEDVEDIEELDDYFGEHLKKDW